MEFARPTDADREFFALLIPDDPGVVVKPMFGNLGAFANGTMFASLLGSDVGVRLSAEDPAELAAVPGPATSARERKGYAVIWRCPPSGAAIPNSPPPGSNEPAPMSRRCRPRTTAPSAREAM